MTDTPHLEAVAHALWFEDNEGFVRTKRKWKAIDPEDRSYYDRLAAAALKALRLREETLLHNAYAVANGAAPERQSRLVSPWVVVEEQKQ